MPLAPHNDEDPVIASYDVYVTNPLPRSSNTSTESKTDARLFVLQYPSHRPLSKPYNNERSQKPTQLRLKPRTGMVEVDIPILTHENFNRIAGHKYGQALAESRVGNLGGSHGLAGGFASGPTSGQGINLNDVPLHGEEKNALLNIQTLGGKIVTSCERDPIYMLGSFQDDELHLTHLNSVVQMRPELHHIDAEEEVSQKNFQSSITTSGKLKPGLETPAAKLESKAIELKMKDNKEDPKDRSLNVNARLLRDIQADQWKTHEWVDEKDQDSWSKATASTTLQEDSNISKSRQLQSMLSNDDWLEKMSVPREDGKKGLRAKLKGRDRERARRKKVEHQRRQTHQGNTNPMPPTDLSSDSDLSSLSDMSDLEMADESAGVKTVDIKTEPGNLAAAPAVATAVPDTVPVGPTPKKRGRPKKNP